MLNVTLNESEIIKKALKGDYNRDNITITLNLLIKHYYLQGIKDELQLIEKLLDYLKDNYKNYKRAKWEELISKIVHRFLKVVKRNKIDVRIIDIPRIGITEKELENIEKLNNINLEKLAFIMLVYAKISNITMNSTEGWINKSCSTICKEAKVNLKGIERERIFNDLYVRKYIEQRKNNSKINMRVCYIDNISKLEIIIDNFDNVIYYYILWKNKDMIACKGCGKPIKVTSNNRKYCSKCWKDVREQQNREKALKYYYKTKNNKLYHLENTMKPLV